MNFEKILANKFFRPDNNLVWDWSTGAIGVKVADGIATVDLKNIEDVDENKTAENAVVNINPITEMSFGLPAFAQSVSTDSIALGDMIYGTSGSKILGWVVGKRKGGRFEILRVDGTRSSWMPPNVKLLNMDVGVMVLRPLFNMLPGGSSDVNTFKDSLMPLMMMSGMMGKDVNFEKIIPFMLMTSMSGGNTGAALNNPMLMMMLMGGNNPFTSALGGPNNKSSNFFN